MTFDEYFQKGAPKVGTPNVFRTADGQYVNDKDEPLTIVNQTFQDPALWTYQDAAGNLYMPRQQPQPQSSTTRVGVDHRVDINKSNQEFKDRMNRYADIAHAVGAGLTDASTFIGPQMGAILNGAKMYLADATTSTAARQLNKYAVNKIIAPLMFRRSVPSVWDGTVPYSYFEDPYSIYRITESPEIGSMREAGYNITTIDGKTLMTPSNRFRLGYTTLYPSTGKIKPMDGGIRLVNLGHPTFNFVKQGAAHGNMTQASAKIPWQANTSASGLFPSGIMEILAPLTVNVGVKRSRFVPMPWDEVEAGSRIGFPTKTLRAGENVRWFLEDPVSGGFKYEGPVLPEKRINLIETPSGMQELYVR